MIFFDSDKSKSTNTVVYFDLKTVIYIYVCGKCRTQFMLPMEKSVTFTGACANQIKSNQIKKFYLKSVHFITIQHKLSRAFQTDMHNKLHKLNTAQ